MSLKELKESAESKKVIFGLKQILKKVKSKKLKKGAKVFVAKDAREEVIQELTKADINFEFLKSKKEISKELGIDFAAEAYLVN